MLCNNEKDRQNASSIREDICWIQSDRDIQVADKIRIGKGVHIDSNLVDLDV